MLDIQSVCNWNDLNDKLFKDSWDTSIKRFRSPYVFRGMSDAKYNLSTSLIRLGGDFVNLEENLLRNFEKYSISTYPKLGTLWELISVAQHHGLPTRLLDWTYSPYIALHFATANINKFDIDGAIWCVDFASTINFLPSKIKAELIAQHTSIFTVSILNDLYKSLQELDSSSESTFITFFEPPSIDSRIVNQFALFSVISDSKASIDEWLSAHNVTFKKIIIPASLKWEIRDRLDQLNINERIIYPGLDGLCSWLKRHYTTI